VSGWRLEQNEEKVVSKKDAGGAAVKVGSDRARGGFVSAKQTSPSKAFVSRFMNPGEPRSWRENDEYCREVMSDLVTLELIARSRSKTKAASLLNISLPALRSRLKPLERRLGGPVVETGRNGNLTPLGKAIRKAWLSVHGPLEDAISGIEKLHDQRVIRIAIMQSLWNSERQWLVSEYAMRMPGVSIEPLFEDGYSAIENLVRDGEVDLGIVSFLGRDERIASPIKRHFWRSEPLVLTVRFGNAMRLSENVEVRREDFKDLHHTLLTMPEHTRMYTVLDEYLRKTKIDRYFRYKVPVRDVNTALDEVIAGHGISILPEPAVKQAVRDLKVETFLLSPFVARPIDLLYRDDSLKAGLVDAFIQCIDEDKKRSKEGFI
jgi:DNA-binding transcriptional LysR family regulator